MMPMPRRTQTLSSMLTFIGLVLLTVFSGAAAIAEGPAVSDINAKVSPFGAAMGVDRASDEGAAGLAGSLTLPLARAFGLQVDGAYAKLSNDDFASTGAHLFWRDPDIGMLGVYGGYAWLDQEGGHEVSRVGLEAQRFIDRVTLDGAVGYRFGDIDHDIYGRAKLDYYPADDLMLSAGYAYEGSGFATLGAEYQFASDASAGAALFAEASLNDDSSYAVLGGLRVFIGESMSLISRHRRQDPPSYLTNDLISTAQAASRYQSRRPGSGPPPICPVLTCLAAGDPCACPSGYERRAACGNSCQVAGGGGCGGWGC